MRYFYIAASACVVASHAVLVAAAPTTPPIPALALDSEEMLHRRMFRCFGCFETRPDTPPQGQMPIQTVELGTRTNSPESYSHYRHTAASSRSFYSDGTVEHPARPGEPLASRFDIAEKSKDRGLLPLNLQLNSKPSHQLLRVPSSTEIATPVLATPQSPLREDNQQTPAETVPGLADRKRPLVPPWKVEAPPPDLTKPSVSTSARTESRERSASTSEDERAHNAGVVSQTRRQTSRSSTRGGRGASRSSSVPRI